MNNDGRGNHSFLEVSVLGPFIASLNGKSLTGFKTNKARALLSYLMVEQGQPIHRESLAGLLWPDLPDTSALSNLRDALSNLRMLLGDHTLERTDPEQFLLVTRNTIQFNPHSNFYLDVIALNTMISRASNLGVLERTISLLRGSFGEGLLMKRSSPFDEWLLVKREQINRTVLSALLSLTNGYEARGEYKKVIEFSRKRLEIEPWIEDAHRQLMRALVLSGERNQAIKQYEACRRLLWEELGVEPERETIKLFESIRDGKLTGNSSVERISSPDDVPFVQDQLLPDVSGFLPTLPFVARTSELESLQGHLQSTLEGTGKVVFISGEAGKGKTALAQEFCRRAMKDHDDLVVAFGQCAAHLGVGDAYLPFIGVLKLLSGDIDNRRQTKVLSADHYQRLWSLMPITARAFTERAPALIGSFIHAKDLYRRLNSSKEFKDQWWTRFEDLVNNRVDSPPSESSFNVHHQTDLFGQYTSILQYIARQHPLVLVLDDLQWADLGTISLLFHLGRHLEGSRILILAIYRSTDLKTEHQHQRHPLESVINEFQRVFGDNVINLDQSEGREFIEEYIELEPNCLSGQFRDRLYERTEGNPLFVIELIRGLQERGDLVKNPFGEWMERGYLNWEKLPRRVEAIIAERFHRIPEKWLSILKIASVEGEVFTAEVLAQIEHQNETELLRYLSGPLTNTFQVVRAESMQRLPTGQRLSRYRFGHVLYQKYLYNQLDEISIQHLHEQVGQTLETIYGHHTEMIADRLAEHYERAGMPMKAAELLLLASQKALLASDTHATPLYRKGLDLLKELPDSPEKLQLELRLQVGLSESLILSVGWDSTERNQAVERQMWLFNKYTDSNDLPGLLLMVFEKVNLLRNQGKIEQGILLAKDFLKLMKIYGDSQSLAVAHYVLAETTMMTGQLLECKSHFETALSLYKTEGNQLSQLVTLVDLDVACLSWLAQIDWILGYPDQALVQSGRAIEKAANSGSAFSKAFVLVMELNLRIVRRELSAAEESFSKLLVLNQQGALEGLSPWLLVIQGWIQSYRGNKDEAIQMIYQGIDQYQNQGSRIGLMHTLIVLLDALYRSNKLDQATTTINVVIQQMERYGMWSFESELNRISGILLLSPNVQETDSDRIEKATELLLKAITVAQKRHVKSLELRATLDLARLWHQQGRRLEAHDLIADIYGWFTEGFDTPDLVDAKQLLDQLSAE